MLRKALMVCLWLAAAISLQAGEGLTETQIRFISQELAQASATQNIDILEKYFYKDSKVVIIPEPNNPQLIKHYSFAQYREMAKTSSRLVESKRTIDEVLSIDIDSTRQRAEVKERLTSFTQTMGLTLKDVVISHTTYGLVDHEVKVLSTELRWLSSKVQ